MLFSQQMTLHTVQVGENVDFVVKHFYIVLS
jgi:hypothetical protein